jgi:hypothetical protein
MYPLPNLHARRLETTAVAHMTECYIMINGPLFLSNSLGTFGKPAVARLFLFWRQMVGGGGGGGGD